VERRQLGETSKIRTLLAMLEEGIEDKDQTESLENETDHLNGMKLNEDGEFEYDDNDNDNDEEPEEYINDAYNNRLDN
jgi:hypothetical protein